MSGAMARGARSTATSQVVSQVVRLGTTVVLARLLVPEDFGVVALAGVIVVLVDHLKDLGTAPAVIQRASVGRALLDSVFWLNVGLGLVLSAGIALTAGWSADLLGQQSAAPVIRAMAVLTVITSLGQVHQALLRRAMRFTSLALVAVVDGVVASAVSVGLAFAGQGVWSIVVGNIVGAFVSTAFLWRMSRWRPSLSASAAELRGIWRFSMHLFGANILWFVVLGQADKFIIGRFLGLVDLGTYALAQRAVSYPLSSVASVVGQVLFPGLSRLQEDRPAMARMFIRASAGVAIILLPAMAGLAVVAEPATHVFFGSKWEHLPPLVWVLAPAGAAQAVTSLVYHLTTAIGRSDWTFRWQVVQSVVFVSSYVVGLPWGLVGVAWAYGLASLLLGPIGVFLAFRLVAQPFRWYLRGLAAPVFATAAMAAAALAAGAMATSDSWSLAASVTVGATTYLGLMSWLRPQAWDDVRTMIRGRLR